ncbi:MAG: hypothetical protein IJV93_03295 [Lentisphaeria bacterium]|nr:hypothetical protein [Lentisphaeria bacterium]
MKAINIVLSILIFLLSAVAATFSYFLFEKRSQFVTGWKKMATVINQSALKLDEGSGTKVASELTVSALAHENYAKLDSLTGKLPAQAASIITERNYLAYALVQVNSRVGNQNSKINAVALQGVDTYKNNADSVVRGVSTVINNRNRTFANLQQVARNSFGVQIDRNQLINGDARAMAPLSQKLNQVQTRINNYDRFIARLCSNFRAPFKRDQPDSNMQALDKAVRAHVADYNKRGQEIRKLSIQKANLERTQKRLEGTIANQKKMIADRDGQITSFQRAFGLAVSRTDTTPWSAGSVEARKAFTAKVVSVNNKYGYFAIDAGKYSVVQQPIGNHVIEVNPNIEPYLAMNVCRRNGDKNEFIARVQISQVGETTSVANIPIDAKPIQVGDIVTVALDDPTSPAAAPAGKSAKR